MHRHRALGFAFVVVLPPLFAVEACGGKILQESESATDAGGVDASTSDAVIVDAGPVCDSISGSTKPTGSGNDVFYDGSAIFASSSIQGFAVGDVNGDGRSDIVAASDALEVFLQNACGGFDAPIAYRGNYGRVAVGDVTRDGAGDVVAIDLSKGGFSVLAQKPDGTLDAPFNYTLQNNEGVKATGGAPILGEFDRDSYLDLFTGDSLGSIYVDHFGGLTLGPLLTTPDGGEATAFAEGDFNGDGRDDIVGTTSDALVAFLQNTDGSFTTVATPVAFHDYPPTSIAVGDFTGDHHDDVAVQMVTSPNSSALAVFPQVDAGVFGAPALTRTDYARAVASGDIDGDGRTDIAGANGASFHLFQQSAPGTLTETTSSFGAESGAFFVLADLDGDGKPDLVSITVDVAKNRTSLMLSYHAP